MEEAAAVQEGDGPKHTETSSRASLLVETFDKCLRYGLRTPSLKEFYGYFPTLPEPVVQALLDLYKQVLTHVEAHSKAEFQDICKEYGLEEKLLDIERLCAQAEASRATAHREQEVTAATEAAEAYARTIAKQQEVQYLQQMLAQATSTRDHLWQVAQQKRQAVQQLADTYRAMASDVKQVYDAGRGCAQQAAAGAGDCEMQDV